MKRILCPIILVVICVLSLCLMSCASTGGVSGEFRINEVFYGNGISSRKPGSVPGFIEFRNPQERALSLDGYFISDDPENPGKYLLDGYSIPGNGYLVIEVYTSVLPADPSMYGVGLYLSDSSGNILQYVAVPPLEKDKSYSLQPDGNWHISDPTPMAENVEGVLYVVQPPVFSQKAGLYDYPFDLELGADASCRVYYTTDGSVPDENSTLYTVPVLIEDATLKPNTLSMRTDITIDGATPPDAALKKATVISAVAIDGNGNRSDVVMNTYFVGFANYRSYLNIPIVSIVADPADLFDIQDGIYVRGKAYQEWLESGGSKSGTDGKFIPVNFRQTEREIPAVVQEFGYDGSYVFSQGIRLSINGSSARDNAQKPFDLYARIGDEYADFRYPMIPDSELSEKYILRTNPGKNSIVQDLLDGLGIPVVKSQPCLCFLNGEFWGFYEITQEPDVEFISDRYGVDRDNLIVVKDNEIDVGLSIVQKLGQEVQELGINGALELLFSELDTSTEEGYRAARSVIDVDNYITYIVANLFFNNYEFLDRYSFWRTASAGSGKYDDGKLRWIFRDMEQSFTSVKSKNALAMLAEDPVFSSLWNNESFRTRFYTLIMDFANVLYTTNAVNGFVSERLAYYDPYYRITSERFMESDAVSYNYAKTLRTTIMDFLAGRRTELISQCGAILTDMRDTCSLIVSGMSSDTKLIVNGHNAYCEDGVWEGVYFSGCEVTFKVMARPGYRFLGWYDGGTLLTDNAVVTVSTDNDHNLMPVFEAIPVVAVMDRINYARSNFKGGYELYTLNIRSNCVIVPDTGLQSSVDFTAILLSSEEEWEKGQGFTITFPTNKLSSCGMILWMDVPEGCPQQWILYLVSDDGEKVRIGCGSEPTENGLKLYFDLPVSCMGSPEVELHLESAEDCAGGTVRITRISLYGYDQ